MTESLIDAETAARVGTVAATATGEVIRRDWQRWAAAGSKWEGTFKDWRTLNTNIGGAYRIVGAEGS